MLTGFNDHRRYRSPPRRERTPFAAWHADHPVMALQTFAEAAAFGETIVNTTAGVAAIDALTHVRRPDARPPSRRSATARS